MQKRSFGNIKKMAAAAAGLLTSAAVLTTAGFAWYTLSTNPEVTQMQMTLGGTEDIWISRDGVNFAKSVDISDKMAQSLSTLRPVSTVDGLNWYVCDYVEGSGDVKQSQFFLKRWCIDENHGEEDHICCDNGGFYAYTDVWLKTSKETADIRLSIANKDENYNSEKVSGSFVMSYAISESNGVETVKLMEKGPETCVRIGLMVMEPTESGTDPVVLGPTEDAKAEQIAHEFFIYEPNADIRSELDKQSDRYLTDKYIAGMEIKKEDFDYDKTDGKYLQTYPIEQVTPGEDTGDERGILEEALPALFPAENLIVQRAMVWDRTAVAKEGNLLTDISANRTYFLTELMQNKFILRDEDDTVHGRFADAAQFYAQKKNEYTPVDMSSAKQSASNVLFTLEKDEIRQVRLFFWIEGQDVDCWNDVAGINFLARIEFATN